MPPWVIEVLVKFGMPTVAVIVLAQVVARLLRYIAKQNEKHAAELAMVRDSHAATLATLNEKHATTLHGVQEARIEEMRTVTALASALGDQAERLMTLNGTPPGRASRPR